MDAIDKKPIPLSINTIAKKTEISIFPNPATDRITFSNPENTITEARIYDVQGRLLITKQIVNGIYYGTLEIEQLSIGTYFLFLNDVNGLPILVEKVIKN